MNVTGIPAQTGLLDAMIEMLTDRFGLTVIVIVLLVAGFPVGQRMLEVRMQDTRSPDEGVYAVMQEYRNSQLARFIAQFRNFFHRKGAEKYSPLLQERGQG